MAPRWVVRLLSVVLDVADHDQIIGDLEELHQRRRRAWGERRATLVTVGDGVVLALRHGALALLRWARGPQWISSVELRLAWRMLWKQPVMTVTSVVALGAGIGMAAGGISVFQQVLFADLPFEDADRWVVIETYTVDTRRRTPLSLEQAELFREGAQSVEYLGGFEARDFNLVHDNGEVERVRGARVSPATFRYLPYAPLRGRLLTVSDGAPEATRVALIRESFWTRTFGRSEEALGSMLDVGGVQYQIVGILPEGAGYPADGELWLPLDERTLGAEGVEGLVAGTRSVAILADGVSVDRATNELQRLSDGRAAVVPGVDARLHRITRMTQTMSSPEAYLGSLVASLILISVLLVIAANVANLVVARTSRRHAELTVRGALGASRSRLVGQLLVESLVLGAVAAIPALAGAAGILSVYDGVLDELPFWIDLSLEASTAWLVLGLAVAASTVVGLVPALQATRRNTADLLRAPRGGGRLGVGRLGEAMIAAEVALSVALIGTAILFAQGFKAYVDPAFDLPDERVLTARVGVDLEAADLRPGGALTVGDSIQRVVSALQAALLELPGARAVGVSSAPPRVSPYPEEVEVEGVPGLMAVPIAVQGPGFFDVLEVEPLVGRGFSNRDLDPLAPRVAVVNRAFAVDRFGTTQVLGRRLRIPPHVDEEPGSWHEIVGVVPDVMEVTSTGGAAGVYFPFSVSRFFTVGLRVDSDPVALTGRVRRIAYDIDPNLDLSEIVRLDEVGRENRTALGLMSSTLMLMGVVALLLSLAGVYSIVSVAVSRRTREIGIRMSLGAARGSILGSILRRSALLVTGGAVVGALAGSQLSSVQLFVFAVPAARAWMFPALVAVMAAAAVLACWAPAHRAVSIDPVEALRRDA